MASKASSISASPPVPCAANELCNMGPSDVPRVCVHPTAISYSRVFLQEQAFNDQTWDVGYYNDYVGVVDIYLLDREDKRRYGIRLWEAFPKTINAIELGNDQTNAIIKTDVSMAFRYWDTLDIQRQPPNVLGRITDTVLDTVQRNLNKNIPSSVRRLF